MVTFLLPPKTFFYQRWVQFSDTDAMGVVHHANYVHYMEEARVAWLRSRGLSPFHYPEADLALAVLKMQVEHLKPARFGDEVKIFVQARAQRLLIEFQYAIQGAKETWLASGRTTHVAVNAGLKPVRLPGPVVDALAEETWTETWL